MGKEIGLPLHFEKWIALENKVGGGTWMLWLGFVVLKYSPIWIPFPFFTFNFWVNLIVEIKLILIFLV